MEKKDISDMSTVALPLELISRRQEVQPREQLHRPTITTYADLYRDDSDCLPPVIVFQDEADYVLADGFHRVEAALQAGYSQIKADIRQGTLRDAILYACGANQHGKPYSQADKRRIVTRLLEDPEWSQWSDREIARRCGVHNTFVGRLRKPLTAAKQQLKRTYRTRHGTRAKMNTRRIGHRTSSAPPSEAITDAAPQGAEDQAKEDHPHETGQNHQAPLAPPAHDPRSASDPQADDETQLPEEAEPGGGPSRDRDVQEVRSAGTPNAEPKAMDCQPESEVACADGPPEAPASRTPDPELHHLLETLASHLSDFRAQHAGAKRVVDSILTLLEGSIQQAWHILEETSPHLERDAAALDPEEIVPLEPEETLAPDDPERWDDASSSEASLAPAERSGVVATVQAFVARRCVPSDEPTSSDALMAAIQTWLDHQGHPPLADPEVCTALHQLGFKDETIGMKDGQVVNSGWQWQGLQLLPADAPDNPVDPFQDARPVLSTEV